MLRKLFLGTLLIFFLSYVGVAMAAINISLVSPTQNEVIKSNIVTLRVEITSGKEQVRLVKFWLHQDDGIDQGNNPNWTLVSETGPWNYARDVDSGGAVWWYYQTEWDATGIADRGYAVTYWYYDKNGNQYFGEQVSFYVDQYQPDIAVSTNLLNFGTSTYIGSYSEKNLTVSNTGDETLNISNITISNSKFKLKSGTPTSFSIAPKGYRDIKVRFYPETTSQETGTLKIYSDDPDENPKSVELRGQGREQAPDANFTYSPQNPCAGTSVQFTDQSSNNPTSWSWNFGDGGTSSSRNPTHTYQTGGRNYTVTLTVSNSGGSDSTSKTIYVGKPTLSVSPTTLDFGCTETQKSFNISNSGCGTLTWNVSESLSWVSVSKTSGSNNDTINVTVDRSGLDPGHHNGSISVTSNGGNATVTVEVDVPQLAVDPTNLDFGTTKTQLTFQVYNSSSGTLTWSLSKSEPWITSAEPQSGSSTGPSDKTTVTVTINRSGMSPGQHKGTIKVESDYGNQDVIVDMTIPHSPEIEITNPSTDPHTTDSTPITISGTCSDEDGDLSSVKVENSANGHSETKNVSGSSDTFSFSVPLNAGNNSITVTVYDSGNRTGTSTITVILPRPPTVSITTPSDDPHITDSTPITISGTCSDADGDLSSVKVENSANGHNETKNVSGSSDNFSFQVPLEGGSNQITITVSDSGNRTDTDTITVIYNPVQLPVYPQPEAQNVCQDSNGTVEIRIEEAITFGGFEFKMKFKHGIIDVLSVEHGIPDQQGRNVIENGPKETIEGEYTTLFYGAASYGDPPPPSGTLLATITFKGVGIGATAFDLFDVKVGNADAKQFPVAVTDGEVTVTQHIVTITSGPTANPNPVDSGKTTQLSVTAADSCGHSINYSWTVSPDEGNFSPNPNERNPTWTAPENNTCADKVYTLTVTAKCTVDPNVKDTKPVEVTVNAQCPTSPTITAINPNSCCQGADNLNVVITGTNFQSGATVTFSGTGITINPTTVDSDTQITLEIDVDSTAEASSRDVTVTNPDSRSCTLEDGFAVNATPAITNITPNEVAQGETVDMVITGTGFQDGLTVSFCDGVTNNSTTVDSNTQTTVNITVSPTVTLGQCQVTVTNPSGCEGSGVFTIICSCFADIDGDGDVDIVDIQKVAGRWGTKCGDERYVPDYDIDKDCDIDIVDIQKVAGHWGETGPPWDNCTPTPAPQRELQNALSTLIKLKADKSKVRVGERVRIIVQIERAVNLGAAEFRIPITFDGSFAVRKIEMGSFPKRTGNTVIPLKSDSSSNREITFGFVSLGENKAPSGNGVLASIELEAQAQGKVTFELSNVQITDKMGNPLPVSIDAPLQLWAIEIPTKSTLLQNFPNPFNPETWIPYKLAFASNVDIQIYNEKGQLVRRLSLGRKEAGYYLDRASAAYWDGRNELGEPVSSGIYFYRIQAGEFYAVRKMVISK